jgi:hypothetical protein
MDDRGDGVRAPTDPAASPSLLGLVRASADALVSWSSADVLRTLVLEGSATLGAVGAFVAVIDGQRLTMHEWFGFDDAVMRDFTAIPIAAPLPTTDAARMGIGVYIGSLEECERLYPSVLGIDPRTRSLAAVPFADRTGTVGVLGVSFDRDLEFDAELRTTLEIVAALCCATVRKRASNPRPEPDADEPGLAARVADLEAEVGAMRELFGFVGRIASERLT